MSKHKNKIIAVLLIIIISFTFFWNHYNTPKIAYVNTTLVYDGFKLKDELENKYKTVQLVRQNLLDSIKYKIQLYSINEKNLSLDEKSKVLELQQSYLIKEKEFNESNSSTAQQYTEQIWKQINQYLDDYGKEKNYDYIFGATGQGNIMYAKEANDITKEVIEYINKKYSGGK